MKKFIFPALAVVLALFTAACAGTPQQETTVPTVQTAPSTTATETTEVTTAATEETEASFAEMVLVDNDDLIFKITGIDENGLMGYTLKVFLENKTDKELMFTAEDASVNGFMCDPFWAETVAAGKKSNTTISWFESEFEANGIETVEEIVFTLRAYDNADWLADDILNQEFTLNP